MPDYTLFRNRFSSRVSHIYKDELAELPEDVRLDIEKTAMTMMLDKMREMDVQINYDDDLGEYIKFDPKNIQYMDLLSWNVNKEEFFARMIVEKPEVLQFLTAEQFNEISEGNPEYIVQLVKENADL